MKKADGLFLSACKDVSEDFPDVKFDEVSLDNACLNVLIRNFALYYSRILTVFM